MTRMQLPRWTPDATPPRRTHRLDDLVWHLTECDPTAAAAARSTMPDRPVDGDEAVRVLARSLVRLKARVPAAVA